MEEAKKDESPKLLTVEEYAAARGLPETKVRQAIAKNRLAHYKTESGRVLILSTEETAPRGETVDDSMIAMRITDVEIERLRLGLRDYRIKRASEMPAPKAPPTATVDTPGVRELARLIGDSSDLPPEGVSYASWKARRVVDALPTAMPQLFAAPPAAQAQPRAAAKADQRLPKPEDGQSFTAEEMAGMDTHSALAVAGAPSVREEVGELSGVKVRVVTHTSDSKTGTAARRGIPTMAQMILRNIDRGPLLELASILAHYTAHPRDRLSMKEVARRFCCGDFVHTTQLVSQMVDTGWIEVHRDGSLLAGPRFTVPGPFTEN